jgi:pimeloyl-ACP methyl ester carboxylesterase
VPALILAIPMILLAAASRGVASDRPGSGPSDGGGPREGETTSADGVPIHYRVEGRGDPALVFVHGWSCDASYWDAQVKAFRGRHRVVTIDLAGHGRSGTGRADWTIPAFAEDVVAVIRHLDLKRSVLIGHSMGGPVTLEVARMLPERVAALVPVDTLQDAEMELSPDELEAFLGSLRDDFVGATGKFVRGMFPADAESALVDKVAGDMSSAPPEVAIGAMRGIFTYDVRAALSQVRTPIRCINSEMHPTMLEINRRYAPQFEVVTMPGLGHFPMLEKPRAFNRLLARAVGELTSGT